MATDSPDPSGLHRLTDMFRQLGANNPESWARSQLEEGIPQLARFCFLKALWEGVVRENDDAWIDRQIESARTHPDAPCTQVGPALEEMLARGVSRQTITDLVRVMQYQVLFHVCFLLDGSEMADLPINNWALHQLDEDGGPVLTEHGEPVAITGVYESLLGMDPTGREMRPRPPAQPAPDLTDTGAEPTP